MTIDIVRQVGATTRRISTREYNGAPARVLVAGRTYDTGQSDLWDALTNIDRIPRWFLPLTGDLRLGGRYQFEGNAGGEIMACDPPHSFSVTWGMHGQDSWLNIQLFPAPGGHTELRLEHIAHVPDDMWAIYGPGAVGVGWDLGLFGLDQHFVTSGGAITPEAATEWMATAEARQMVTLLSEAWAAANIADGADPAAAQAAAANTTAFYLGEG